MTPGEFNTQLRAHAPALEVGLHVDIDIYWALVAIAHRAGFPRQIRKDELLEVTLDELWAHIEASLPRTLQ